MIAHDRGVGDPTMSNRFELGSLARLSAHTIRDHLTDPPCTTPGDFPWRAEALSPAWLTPVLCRDDADAAVNAVHVEDASAGSSVRKRVQVTYNAAGQRAGLATKFFAKTTPSILTRLTSGPSANQEAKFFSLVRPQVALETPVHVVSVNDRISGRSLHLFEDLVDTEAAVFCDYKTDFSRAEIDAAFDLLATLHGKFYADQALADALSWVPAYETFFDALARTGNRAGHDQAMREAQAVIPAAILAAKDELWPAAIAALDDHAEAPRTLIHSDVHPGNWYLTGDGKPGLCDWQCIAQGHWARDVAYAMSAMLDVAQRRAWERDVLRQYLVRLREHGGPAIAFDDAWTLYRRQLPLALLMWTPTLCHPPTMPDMQPPDVSLEMIRRITTAIDDLGGLP